VESSGGEGDGDTDDDTSPYIDVNNDEVLNWQLTLSVGRLESPSASRYSISSAFSLRLYVMVAAMRLALPLLSALSHIPQRQKVTFPVS